MVNREQGGGAAVRGIRGGIALDDTEQYQEKLACRLKRLKVGLEGHSVQRCSAAEAPGYEAQGCEARGGRPKSLQVSPCKHVTESIST